MNNGNMRIYDAVRTTPDEAKKPIAAGRLKGFTDINPMYRIRRLTELFGPCGVGWYYMVSNRWTEEAGNEILCFVDIDLFVRTGEETWSRPIHGTGGSGLLVQERSGLHADDEAYKKATTDALSVACKQLGIGADVYWERGESKYSTRSDPPQEQASSRVTKIKSLCNSFRINLADFGYMLKELQEAGEVENALVNEMTEQGFISLLDKAAAKLKGGQNARGD